MRTNIFRLFLLFAIAFATVTGNTKSACSQESQTTETEFSEIAGKVTDSKGKPLEKFTVAVHVYSYSEGWNSSPSVLGKWKGDFENGEFQFDVDEPIEINDRTYISRTVTAAGFLELNRQGNFVQMKRFQGDFGKIKLFRGVKLKGKLVLPEGHEDEEIDSPRLLVWKKMSRMMPDYNNMFQKNCQVKEDGSFEITVPEDCNVTVTASSNNAAVSQQKVTVPKFDASNEEIDLGEIKLNEGVRVSGVVIDQEGQPVEGQIVQISQDTVGNPYMQNSVRGNAISDAEGKFTLPPREGKCRIRLINQAYIGKELVKVKDELLMAKPMSLTLRAGKTHDDIEIRECQTWKIHGVVNFNDSRPSVNVGYSGDSQTTLEVDENGRFEAKVLDKSAPYLVFYHKVGDQVFMAKMTADTLNEFRDHFGGTPEQQGQYFQLKPVTCDIGPLQFDMVEYYSDNRSWTEQLIDWWIFGD